MATISGELYYAVSRATAAPARGERLPFPIVTAAIGPGDTTAEREIRNGL